MMNLYRVVAEKKDSAKPKPTEEFPLLPRVINGAIAGIVGVTVVFPLDLVKTRLQNQKISPGGKKLYKNMLDGLKKVYAAEGYFGMYRGSGVNILLVTPEKSIKLTCNDMFRHYLKYPDGSLPIYRQMIAGGMAGACQIIITTPMELLKIRMQDQGRVDAHDAPGTKKRERLTAYKMSKQLWAQRGIRGLYQGFGATAVRDISFSVIYFPLFSVLSKLYLTEEITTIPFWWSFVSGLSSGMFAAFTCTPLDVVKTRLQTMTKQTDGKQQYDNVLDCVLKIFKNEGIKAFFKGGACRVMVVGPLFGIAQAVYYMGIAEKIIAYYDK